MHRRLLAVVLAAIAGPKFYKLWIKFEPFGLWWNQNWTAALLTARSFVCWLPQYRAWLQSTYRPSPFNDQEQVGSLLSQYTEQQEKQRRGADHCWISQSDGAPSSHPDDGEESGWSITWPCCVFKTSFESNPKLCLTPRPLNVCQEQVSVPFKQSHFDFTH